MNKISLCLFLFPILFSAYSMGAQNCAKPPSPAAIQRSAAFLANTPCEAVIAACNNNGSGYILNRHACGNGLVVDCLEQLFKGATVANITPPAPAAVAQCKAYCKSAKGACAEQKGVADR